MAIDSNVTPSEPGSASVSAIDNEFPAYRAISPLAVTSLVFGAISILCFTHWFFLTFAILAILMGIYADRKIQRMPDVLTGRGLAQSGIALGLIFSLSSLSIAVVQDFVLLNSSKRFIRTYMTALKEGSIEKALWFQQNPTYRKDKSPAEIVKEMKKSSPEPRMFEFNNADLHALITRISSSPQEKLEFVKIENYDHDGLGGVASALLEVRGPGTKEYPEKEEFALILLRGGWENRRYQWSVDSVKFPYKPNSYVPAKPVDDGHGHGQGGHGH